MALLTETDKEFKEITGIRLNNFSQLQKYDILREDDYYIFNIFKYFVIDDDIKENEEYLVYYDVDFDDWWENIASKYYENENLWWIVADANDVVNPFEELNQGETIKVIDRNLLYNIVKEIKTLSE